MRPSSSMSRTSLRGILFRASLKVVSGAHKLLYRATGGHVATRIWGLSVLLLTTRGRKTGRPRTTPLCFLRDGDDLVVAASNGGMDWSPSWWLNLLREPHATIEIGRTRRAIRARQATPEERERLWTQLTSVAPGYLRYQARTSREIPLAILQPADSSFGDRGTGAFGEPSRYGQWRCRRS
jgi:F420H(2)-dependent quinone reductase